MSFYEHVLTLALEKSECVALFIIVLLLVFFMHNANSARLKILTDEVQKEVERNDHKWARQGKTNRRQPPPHATDADDA